MSNMIYSKIEYISWKNEAKKIILSNDEMINKIKEIRENKTLAKTNTKRSEYMDGTKYKIDRKGDYVCIYTRDNGEYIIYCNNVMDSNKNEETKIKKVDFLFDLKFRELNGISIRRAFGFSDKSLKRCIPKQFYYIDSGLTNRVLKASCIDANSQYPSGCLYSLPDSHTAIKYYGRVLPTAEYPFAFYKSGHCAEYGVFDTHNWLDSKLAMYLFRWDPKDSYSLLKLSDTEEETILMKASPYEMTSTWEYFYNIKQTYNKNTEEYKDAKLIMNKTIGCWHRKDKDKKSIMTYDDHGSYQLAHIVAIAIGRGNQKILNMLKKINPLNPLFGVLHICVDGIIYMGSKEYGNNEHKLGEFTQEFTNCDFMMQGINVYCAMKDGKCIVFKHGSYDLLDGQEIDENKEFTFNDLNKLGRKERVGDVL